MWDGCAKKKKEEGKRMATYMHEPHGDTEKLQIWIDY